MSIITDVFTPIYGKPCWQVHQGYGSFLTFEFGEPHLTVREPRPSSKVPTIAARRLVVIHGDWHLWAYLCDWRILSHGRFMAHCESSRSIISKATSELNGQLLQRVTVHKSLMTVFEFDLGGRLETRPNIQAYGKTSTLWHLYEPSGEVFSLRSDGKYDHGPGDSKDKWQLLRK